MRRGLLVFAVLIGCSEPPIVDDPVAPPPAPMDGAPAAPFVPEPIPPARYFTAVTETNNLRFHSAAFQHAKPRRLSPLRGAGYGLGPGDVRLLSVDPSQRLAIVHFAPSHASGRGGLFVVSIDGADADAAVPIAEDVSEVLRFANDGEWIAYVCSRGIEAVRLDGTDAARPRLVLPLEVGDDVDRLELRNGFVAAEIWFWRTGAPRVLQASLEEGASTFLEEGIAFEHLLIDGRVVVRGPGLEIQGSDGRSEWIGTEGHVLASSATHLLVSTTTWDGGVDIDSVTIALPHERQRQLELRSFSAKAPSADGRWLYILGVRSGVFGIYKLSLDGDFLPNGGYLSDTPNTTQRQLAVARDGSFALACAHDGVRSFAAGREAELIHPTCYGEDLAGLVANDRVAAFVFSRNARFLNLEDGTVEYRADVGPFAVPAGDGLVDVTYRAALGTIYRVDVPGRHRQLVPWDHGPVDVLHRTDDRIVYRQGDEVRSVDTRGAESPRSLATLGFEHIHLGVTDKRYVNVHSREGYPRDAPWRIVAVSVDGSAPPASSAHLPFAAASTYGAGGGYVYQVLGNEVLAARVDATDLELERVFESDDPLLRHVYDEARERLVVVSNPLDRMVVWFVALDGSTAQRFDVGRSPNAQLYGIEVFGRRALLSFIARGSWSFAALDLDSPTALVAIEAGPDGVPVPFADGESALVKLPLGTAVVSLASGALQMVAGAPLDIAGRRNISPSEAWFFGISPSGQLVVAPTDGSIDARVYAEDAIDAVFTPDDRVLFTAVLEDDEGPALFVRRPKEDSPARRISPAGFAVTDLFDADDEGAYVRSTNGGDASVYYLPFDGGAPIPVTPIDDADELSAED